MEDNKIRIGITQGDINGVGYEVILKTFAEPAMLELCTPIVYGSPKVAAYHRKSLDLPTNFSIVESAEDAAPDRLSIVNCNDDEVKVTIQSKDFHFPGHTEYIEQTLGEGEKALMILMKNDLRVALVTGHIPVSKIASVLNKELIKEKLRIFHRSLKLDFDIEIPRIAVLSLNPHAGDEGLLGTEEQDIIIPAMKEAGEEGILCFGPFPVDGFMGAGGFSHFDGILAMYHDQGLAPFKALAMDEGVNFTAGLPVVRTSPAHGTAYDIAGKGVASEDSFRQAIYVAIDVYRNRQRDLQARSNPLRKLYYEKRDDSDKLKLDSTTEAEL